MSKISFLKSTLIVAAAHFLSRVLGLLRTSLMGAYFGATDSAGLADAYGASFILPDIIYNLIAFGTISIVLIPYFSHMVEKKEFDKFNKSCSAFLNFFFLSLATFIVIAILTAPIFVTHLLAKGWTDDPHKLKITIQLTRIMLLQPLFMALSGIFGAYLNSIERFKAYSFAILSYNVGIIFGIVVLSPFFSIYGVAFGVIIGSMMHFTIQLTGSMINGYRYTSGLPKWTKEIRDLFLIAIPRIIAIGGEQLVRFFIVSFSSMLFTGALAIYTYAENFSMVPFSLVAVSLATTSFPVFSKLYVRGDYDEMFANLFNKLRIILFLMVPATVLMILFRYEIIEILLGYKEFSDTDVMITAGTLPYYMVGMPFFAMTLVLFKFYYAQQKSITPMLATFAMALITIISLYAARKSDNMYFLAYSRSLGYIAQTTVLFVMLYIINLKEKLFSKLPLYYIVSIVKIIIINVILFIVLSLILNNMVFNVDGKINALLRLLAGGGIAAVIYIGLTFIFGMKELLIIVKK